MIPFQSHQTHRLSWPLIGLGDRLGWLTALGPRSFLPVVLVCGPFYIASYHRHRHRHRFSKESQASIRSKRFFCINSYIELLLETSLMQMLPNDFLANLQFVGNGISARMSVQLENFHDFIDIFDDWPSREWCIFDIEITGTEVTKPILRLIGFYSIRTINIIHIFSCLGSTPEGAYPSAI